MSHEDCDKNVEIISSPDLDNHINNLIKNISDDECDVISSCPQHNVSDKLTCGCFSLHKTSFCSSDDMCKASQSNESIQNLQPKRSSSKDCDIKPSTDAGTEYGKGPVVSECSLRFHDMKATVYTELLTNFTSEELVTINTQLVSEVIDTAVHRPGLSTMRKRSSQTDNECLHLSSSWPGIWSKSVKDRCQLHPEHINIIMDDDFVTAKKYKSQSQETFPEETGPTVAVFSHSSTAADTSLETGADCRMYAEMQQNLHDASQELMLIAKAVITCDTSCVSAEPDLAKSSKKTSPLLIAEESSVSIQMHHDDLAAYSPSDILPLCSSEKSPSDIFSSHSIEKSPTDTLQLYSSEKLPLAELDVKQDIQLLDQNACSSVCAFTAQESSQSCVEDCAVLLSPVKSNDTTMDSVHSHLLTNRISEILEQQKEVESSLSPTIEKSSYIARFSPLNAVRHKEPSASSENMFHIISQSNEQQSQKLLINSKEDEPYVGDAPDISHELLVPKRLISSASINSDDVMPSHSTVVSTLNRESLDIRPLCLKQDEIFSPELPVAETVRISQNFHPLSHEEPLERKSEENGASVYGELTKSILPECEISALYCDIGEIHPYHYKRNVIESNSKYEYQEMPRSPQMLINREGIPYVLPDGYHIVPHYTGSSEKNIHHDTENLNVSTSSNSGRANCEEATKTQLSESEMLDSVAVNCSDVGHHKANLSWPVIVTSCTVHSESSKRVSLTISDEIDDNESTCTNTTADSQQLCWNKQSLSHLYNESTFTVEMASVSEEHRVPESGVCEDVCCEETSMYSNLPDQKPEKQEVKQAFRWNSVYETVMMKSFTEQATGDTITGLSSILPIVQCHRPLRVGLSRKERVKHLHSKP